MTLLDFGVSSQTLLAAPPQKVGHFGNWAKTAKASRRKVRWVACDESASASVPKANPL
jgi:hypothetical protein